MSAMAEMSRAIRETLERHSADGKLSGVPSEALEEFVQIAAAFLADMRDEQKRRKPA